ncbi:trk system potassium uptake protein TrkA [Mesonia hippocampi]|uniref:Trk system potassium uptake protein TrkA n=1 Tax=Mesonia hippocampi TaxID=1628250 RepID=A0A840EI85_9FLAO|nr:Trk system potassium transporter TrkA [Mesonia hippocampi]MBB4119032.1 trk system potassium uptake protein TrkA [Mesonia hippocampi]
MKIIIAGAGEVGFHLAKLLSYESQNITLIDNEQNNLQHADSHLDIITIKGDATSIKILTEAQVDEADLVISVTSSETTNITICVLAKQLGAKRTIARISNEEFIERKSKLGFKRFGIDELISPESLAAKEIEELLNRSAFNDTFMFDQGALTMVGFKLAKNAPFVGETISSAVNIFPDLKFVTIAVQRYGTQYTLIPRGNTVFKEGDQVYFVTTQDGVDELYKLTGKTKHEIKNIMILGGSKIGRRTAKSLCDAKFNVKLIESNREKAFELADELPKTLVIHSDGRDAEVLEEENIYDMDAFIAVTGNSETNIMTCLMAKSKGVMKTISLVENMDYFQLSHSIGINTLINKKLLAANTIFRYIRKGDVVAMTKLNNMNAELLEFIVKEDSKVSNKRIADIKWPRNAIVGGVIRNKEGIIPMGDFTIKPNDRIVVCCLPQAIRKVENLL